MGYVSFGGYISDQLAGFSVQGDTLRSNLKTAYDQLAADSSNPEALVNYQAVLASYTLYTSAETNVMKTDQQNAAGVISNLRQ